MSIDLIMNHKGHNVICKECYMQATEFIDYRKAIMDNRVDIYNTNKCWCTLPMHFYCRDCKVDIELDKE